MKVVYAPDSYGGFLSAPEACRVVARELLALGTPIVAHPMADGGEGTLLTLVAHLPARLHEVRVTDVRGVPVNARLLQHGDFAFAEAAQAVGLARYGSANEAWSASSYGLGQLLSAAEGVERLLVGLGGSATVDGGAGMLQALGLDLLDRSGRRLEAGAAARDLSRVTRVEGPRPLPGTGIEALADVRTVLADAPRVFGPQKGLRTGEVGPCEIGLLRLADALDDWRSRQGLPPVPRDLPGGGAAGGLGLALAALFDAPLAPGAARVAELTDLDGALAGADVVVLGEGRLDATSYQGKVAGEVTARARAVGATVLALVGSVRGELPPAPRGPDRVFCCDAEAPRVPGFESAARRLGGWLAGL